MALFATMAAFALILIAAAFAFSHFHGRRSAPPLSTEWEQLTFFTDSAVYPALSPDGRMLSFIRGHDTFFGPGDLYVKLLPDGEPVQLTHDNQNKLSPAFSPDGSRIAYSTAVPWTTWTVPVLGGQPQLMLPNSSSLTWIDGGKYLLFSEIKEGLHLAVVTTDLARGQSRDVYVPPNARGMAHYSYLSPDGKWVLIVEMNARGELRNCLYVPFRGNDPPKQIGDPSSVCKAAAWSADGKWVYFTQKHADRTHIWRRLFPDGQPEQVTNGTNDEDGIAVAPDGKSLITSVGVEDTMVWIHDQKGDHQVASEGDAMHPRLSADGKKVYYLYAGNQKNGHELWVTDIAGGNSASLLPGYSPDDFAVSADGQLLAFTLPDEKGRPALWLAPANHRSSPRKINAQFPQDQPVFLPNGDLLARVNEGSTNSVYRMGPDGSNPRKLFPTPILELSTASPDGRWVLAAVSSTSEDFPAIEVALPVEGGAPVPLCGLICDISWGPQMDFLFFEISGQTSTYAVPLRSGHALPDLPPTGITSLDELKKIKGVKVLPQPTAAALSLAQYVYTRQNIRRNLYRVPIP